MKTKPYLISSFSVNLLNAFPAHVSFVPITVDEARALLAEGFESVIGHANTAALFSALLGMEAPSCRETATLPPGARAVLGQYRGPRLKEGCAQLPEGSRIEWFRVVVEQGAVNRA